MIDHFRLMARSHQWISIAADSWLLGWEASTVIGLRLMKMSTFDQAAAAEASLMVTEKIGAAMGLGAMAITGSLGKSPETAARKSVNHYRKAVRRNRRRLG